PNRNRPGQLPRRKRRDRFMPLSERQAKLCDENQTDYSDLKAVVFNCTLKREAGKSHTRLLLSVVEEMLKKNGVHVDYVHPAARSIALGVQPDMREHGWARDEW